MKKQELTLVTFGDSVLDSAAYSQGTNAGELLVRNDDRRFPEFRGKDLSSRGAARLLHLAKDGSTVDRLREQRRGLRLGGPVIAIVSVGGNDLIQGLFLDQDGEAIAAFGRNLEAFVRSLEMPVLLATVYDPSLGSDEYAPLLDLLDAPEGLIPWLRSRHRAVNSEIARLAGVTGSTLVDLHAHFLTGRPEWFERIIEPSLTGASEVRRAFLPHVLRWGEGVRGGVQPDS